MRKLPIEHGFQDIAKEGDARLHMDIEMTLRDVQQVMLSRVTKSVDGLKCESLFLGEILDLAIANTTLSVITPHPG